MTHHHWRARLIVIFGVVVVPTAIVLLMFWVVQPSFLVAWLVAVAFAAAFGYVCAAAAGLTGDAVHVVPLGATVMAIVEGALASAYFFWHAIRFW